MKTNLIQITEENAPALSSVVNGPGWEQFELILKQAHERARDDLEGAKKNLESFQGIAQAFNEICHIRDKIDEVLTPIEQYAAEVDGNPGITIEDVRTIARYAYKIILTWPIEEE